MNTFLIVEMKFIPFRHAVLVVHVGFTMNMSLSHFDPLVIFAQDICSSTISIYMSHESDKCTLPIDVSSLLSESQLLALTSVRLSLP